MKPLNILRSVLLSLCLFAVGLCQATVNNPAGPVTIITQLAGNLGYVAYAQTISEIIADAHPEKEQRIIIQHHHEHSNLSNIIGSFTFPAKATIEVRSTQQLNENPDELNNWLENASLIIAAATIPASIKNIDRYNYIYVRQLGVRCLPSCFETGFPLAGYIENYRELLPEGFNDAEQKEEFEREFWRSRFVFNLRDYNYLDKINERIESPETLAKEIYSDYLLDDFIQEANDAYLGRGVSATSQNKANHLTMGFSENSAGMLIPPHIQKRVNKEDGLSFDNDFLRLKAEVPDLGGLIDRANGHFYTAYMHKSLSFAEFTATAALIDQQQDTWVLSNIVQEQVVSPAFTSMMKKHGAGIIEFIDLREPENSSEYVLNSQSRKKVHLVRLPKITSSAQHASLFYFSQPLVGVTGNQSLFIALTLGKLPMYEANLNKQINVNHELAVFADPKRLAPFFNNQINPVKKASIAANAGNLVSEWATKITSQKNANKAIINAVRRSIDTGNTKVK